MAQVPDRPWWEAPRGYVFCIVEGGFDRDDHDEKGVYYPREDNASVHPMFIDALMRYNQREYPYFKRGRIIKLDRGHYITSEYIAELKSGMFDELGKTTVFLCDVANVVVDGWRLTKPASETAMIMYPSSSKRKPVSAIDLLHEYAEERNVRLVEYDEYLPFREYYRI